MLKAVCFDLWDTMIRDDSDEPKRADLGLRSKRDERRHLVWRALNDVEAIEQAAVDRAYDEADAAFATVWHDDLVTWSVGERLERVLKGLGRDAPPNVLDEIVKAHEEMEVAVPPDIVPGIADVLGALTLRYRLCVVSDTIISPGKTLRRLLEHHGIKDLFTGFAFSDEVGRSKPHRAMFEAAADQLGVDLDEMAHIGDREHNDIKGPQALGMKTVLATYVKDRGKDATAADAVCETPEDLPEIIDRLAATS